MPTEELKLSEDQQKAYDLMRSGVNCYISGDGGTGKSFLINYFIEQSKKDGLKVIACAPTGMAADVVNGVTIHRAFGYPVCVLNAFFDPVKVTLFNKTSEVPSHRWINNGVLSDADIIVIDEISEVRIDLFELLSAQIRDENRKRLENKEVQRNPIQLIVAGDFSQVPPVMIYNKDTKRDEPNKIKQIYPYSVEGYAFEARGWGKMNFSEYNLKEVIRQNDVFFSAILKRIKLGDESALWELNDLIKNKWDGEAVVICGTKDEVNEINKEQLDKLPGKCYVFNEEYEMASGFYLSDADRRNDSTVFLKVGARVQCLINDKEKRYLNGSIGTITDINGSKKTVTVLFDKTNRSYEFGIFTWKILDGHDNVVGEVKQIPLRLNYAITVHKVQGQTYDKVCLKPDIYFSPALHYVAVSRCTTLEGLQFYGNKFTEMCTFKSGYQKRIKLTSDVVLKFLEEHSLL